MSISQQQHGYTLKTWHHKKLVCGDTIGQLCRNHKQFNFNPAMCQCKHMYLVVMHSAWDCWWHSMLKQRCLLIQYGAYPNSPIAASRDHTKTPTRRSQHTCNMLKRHSTHKRKLWNSLLHYFICLRCFCVWKFNHILRVAFETDLLRQPARMQHLAETSHWCSPSAWPLRLPDHCVIKWLAAELTANLTIWRWWPWNK